MADEINSRETVTVLVLSNAGMTTLAGNRPLAAVKAALRLLTILDYYDAIKLHKLSEGSVLTTTLLQTTGAAPGNLGFINLTDLAGGKVGFGSSFPGSKLDSTYTRSVKQIPYSLSVLEISAPIVYPGLLDAPTMTSDLIALLTKAGCKTFASLISSSGVLKIYQSIMAKGLTVFAPNDEAFTADGVPDLSTLSNAEVVSLLQYHAVPAYVPKASLLASKGPVSTLASNGAGKYDLTVKIAGDEVTLVTGVDDSRVASTVVDDPPYCVLTVDNLLMPTEIFGKAPAPAPGLEPAAAPAPVSEAPAPEAVAPAPEKPLSPPAPPAEAPADSPEGKPADSKSDKGSAVGVDSPLRWIVLSAAVVLALMWS